MEEKKTTLLAVLAIQCIYTGMFLLSKAAFDVGMNTYVFVFYRQAFATVFFVPIAFFIERKTAPPLSLMICIKIFILSLVGITLSLDIYNVGLQHTSASLAAATSNTIPVITFFFALLLRMEQVKLKAISGMAKIVGLGFCLGGAATIAFYRGPYLRLLVNHHLLNFNHVHDDQSHHHTSATNSWTKGVLLMLLSNTFWSLWLVLQVPVLKSYPSKLCCTAIQCLFSTIQAFIIAIAMERDVSEWKLGWNVRLLSVAYCGIMVTGFAFYLQAYVVEKKGPVYLAITNPLSLLFTICASAVLFGEIINFGSVLGAILLIGGLYFVQWGKIKEEKDEKQSVQTKDDGGTNCSSNQQKFQNSCSWV